MKPRIPSVIAAPVKNVGKAIQFAHAVWNDAQQEQAAAVKRYGRIFSE